MSEYILLMYDDAINPQTADDAAGWALYLSELRASGQFDGGSSIGAGTLCQRGHAERPAAMHINGYIRVRADSLEHAKQFLRGNPTFEAGGTVEVRELPQT